MHPKVIEKYREAKIDFEPSANDTNIARFDLAVEKSKEPVKQEIIQIFRLQSKGKERFYYQMSSRSKDNLGSKIEKYETFGYYDLPSFNYRVDENGNSIATAIEDLDRVYELNWPEDFTPELEEKLSDRVSLVLITSGRRYGGFSLSDFKECSPGELLNVGKYGIRNPTDKQIIERVEGGKK
jgi:hypothetical protein